MPISREHDESYSAPLSGLVLLRDTTTLLRASQGWRLVLLYNITSLSSSSSSKMSVVLNKNTTHFDLIKFLSNDIPLKIISTMIEQEAFTYESIGRVLDVNKGAIERVIHWLHERGFVSVWGNRYNPSSPNTKIWLIHGGDPEKAKALKRRTP